ncbi:MAG: 50S ribosomal protein L11 methyltransferase [Chthonomonadales bacterium]|nr:50S ribosomal protein L11 methyltransferase [Chthonomonadales bacterium]
MRWAEIRVEAPIESADAVAQALIDIGSNGVAVSGEGPRVLTGHLPVSDTLQEALDRLTARLDAVAAAGLAPAGKVSLRLADDEDWANEWRKHFQPLEVGQHLLIKPTWVAAPPGTGRVVVELDPGMAFGTGGHPTTRLCLTVLEQRLRPGDVVADIGTGSGILALAAARLGAARVFATDIDRLPRETAAANVKANNLDAVVSVLDPAVFDRSARACDIVVANIISDTLIELAPAVAPRLRPAGLFVGCGIVADGLPGVVDAYAAQGLVAEEVMADDYWRALICRAPGDPARSEPVS